MKRWWLPAIVLVLMAAACAQATPSGGGGDPGRLVVSQEMDRSGSVYIEGYVAFIAVTQDGHSIFSDRLPFDEPLSHELPSGSYELSFTVRPCDGNCGYLDPVTETCSLPLTVGSGETVRAHVIERPSKDCSISIRAA
jgi:hypothetical protein